MEIQVSKSELIKAVGTVIGAVSPRSTLPVLGNLLIETDGTDALKLSATDLEIALCTKVNSKNMKEGSITVPARKFYEITKELPGDEILLTVAKNNAVNIKSGKSHCRIMGLGVEDFPKFPEINTDQAAELEQKTLKTCLSLTAFAISHDETRYVLNGVLIILESGKIKLVATDGRRLAYVEKPIEGETTKPFQIIVPIKAINELIKILEVGKVKLIQNQNQVIFQVGDTYLASRLIEGHFPNYEQVIPKEEKTIGSVNRQAFLSAVKRAALFTSQDAQAVKLDFVKNKILVSSHSPNLGEVKEELDAEVTGDDVTIGFNPHYLLDVLKNTNIENISLSLTKPDKPGLVKTGDDNYLYVVMPMQIA